jgi:hypothetical protein
MSMGRAIITTDAPGSRETVRNEEMGYLYQLVLWGLVENGELIQRFGQRSY